jgi:hypothetical protein
MDDRKARGTRGKGGAGAEAGAVKEDIGDIITVSEVGVEIGIGTRAGSAIMVITGIVIVSGKGLERAMKDDGTTVAHDTHRGRTATEDTEAEAPNDGLTEKTGSDDEAASPAGAEAVHLAMTQGRGAGRGQGAAARRI